MYKVDIEIDDYGEVIVDMDGFIKIVWKKDLPEE